MVKWVRNQKSGGAMEYIHNLVQSHAIAVSGIILLIAYFFIATEKISKVSSALAGGAIVIFLGLVEQSRTQDAISLHYFVNFIDFNVIFLLVSMMIIVHITARSGVFNWISNELLTITKGHPVKILWALGFFTAVASAFLDNVTTVILIMPITFFIAKKLDINPFPYLITEILTSNIGGTATLIGDPPNIIIASRAGFSFMDFVNELTGVVVVILFVTMWILTLMFRKKLVASSEKMLEIVHIDNSKTITDKKLLVRSCSVLAAVIVGFILHDAIHIESYLVAMLGASYLLIFEEPKKVLKEVEWSTIFFFIGLFIIIGALEASGAIGLMAQWLLDVTKGSEKATAMIILWASGILSGVIDNIPYTATMAPLLQQIEAVKGAQYVHPLWWCLSLGACLGGNSTIIGAAANVLVAETALAKGHRISFIKYLKYGLLITFVSLLISSGYIWFRFLRHVN